MSNNPNLPLARQLRPRKFSEVHGHQSVIQALKKILFPIKHHTFLLTGSRGLGKTSIGRLMGQSLLCQHALKDCDPCGNCEECTRIQSGSHPDLFEVDGASKSKVEDIREIISSCASSPLESRYKVYLIDEVHMLSTHAFNALLKTLEEPPSHVVFILATTEPQKIPSTIRSRCLCFHLNSPSLQQMCTFLQDYCDEKRIPYTPETIRLISDQADGSYRDLLNILEYLLVLVDSDLSHSEIFNLFHALSQDEVKGLIECLIHGKIVELKKSLEASFAKGIAADKLFKQLLSTIAQEHQDFEFSADLYCEISKAFEHSIQHHQPQFYASMSLLRICLNLQEKKKALIR